MKAHTIVRFKNPEHAFAVAPFLNEYQTKQDKILSSPSEGWVRVEKLDKQARRALEASGAEIFREPTFRIAAKGKPRVIMAKDLEAMLPMTKVGVPTHGGDKLHKMGYYGERIHLTVVDTGIAKHQDLAPVSRFDDVFTDNANDPQNDDHGHGTHCTGIAAGIGAKTVLGMAPKAKVSGAKVLDDQGSGTWASVMKGYERAIAWAMEDMKNDPDAIMVVSSSLGGRASKPPTQDEIAVMQDKANQQHGILFVNAAGNSGPGEKTVGTPAIALRDITVGAIDTKQTVTQDDDAIARFSSRGVKGGKDGQRVDIGFNGVDVLSTTPGDQYAAWDGTSMATPFSAGAAVLVLDMAVDYFKQGKLTVHPRELIKDGRFNKLMEESAVKMGKEPESAVASGNGRADLCAALLLEKYGKKGMVEDTIAFLRA